MDQLCKLKVKKLSVKLIIKLEIEGVINVDTIKQEIEDNKLSNNNIHEDKINPYCNVIINDIDKENISTSQMQQCLILSTVINYVQYDRNHKQFMI